MFVKFYNKTLFTKRLNSTKPLPVDIEPLWSGECTLKEPTSITNPQIVITHSDVQAPDFFYCDIAALARKYFVVSCESLLGGRWLFNLHVDVLGTYSGPLSLTREYVLRSSNSFSPLLIDSQVPIYADSTVQKVTAGRIFTDQTAQGMYVMGLSCANAQGALSGGSVNYYCMGANAMVAVMRQIFNATNYYSGISATEVSEQLFKSLFNPGQYIQSVKWFPFQNVPSDATPASSIDIGYWSFPVQNASGFENSAYVLNNTSYVTLTGSIQLPFHPDLGKYPFANYSPYSTRLMHFPPFGDISLNDPRYINPTLIAASYYMLCDLISGQGHLLMFAGLNYDTYVSKHSNQIGVPVAYSTYYKPMEEFTTGNMLKKGIGFLSAGVSELMRQNTTSTFLGKVGNGLLTSDVIEESGGSAGDSAQYADNPYIVCIFKSMGDIDVEHMGRPLMEIRQLSTISGFCSCYDCDVVCPTVEETQELQNYVKTGFYAEWS